MSYDQYCGQKQRNIDYHLNSSNLSEVQKEQLKLFLDEYAKRHGDRKLSTATLESYARSISYFGQFLYKNNKEFKEATKKDLEEYLTLLESKSRSIRDWARMALKVFYRWLVNGKVDRKEPFPELVSWIKVGYMLPTKIQKDDCLTSEEVERMLAASLNTRDRAFISVLFDTGGRLGELLNLRVKHVKLDGDLPHLFLPISKTKPRKVGLLRSVHDLSRWLQAHPLRGTSNYGEAFVFCTLREYNGKKRSILSGAPWGYETALTTIKRTARRAGIKKPVKVHLFRHSAASLDRSLGMPDQFMNLKYGWSENSKMASRYAHVDFTDVFNFQKRALGLETKDNNEEYLSCWRCNERNNVKASNCTRCFSELSEAKIKSAPGTIESMQKAITLMNEVFEKRLKEVEAQITTKGQNKS